MLSEKGLSLAQCTIIQALGIQTKGKRMLTTGAINQQEAKIPLVSRFFVEITNVPKCTMGEHLNTETCHQTFREKRRKEAREDKISWTGFKHFCVVLTCLSSVETFSFRARGFKAAFVFMHSIDLDSQEDLLTSLHTLAD